MANKTIIKAYTDKAGVSVGATDLTVSSSLKLSDGTAGTPGLHFKDDTNLGLFRPTTDELGISTAGSERVRIDAAGNVGIGTTSPDRLLHAEGGAAGAVAIRVKNTDTSANTYGALEIEATNGVVSGLRVNSSNATQAVGDAQDMVLMHSQNENLILGTNDAARMTIKGGGSVGIGTTNPAPYFFHTSGTVNSDFLCKFEQQATTTPFVMALDFSAASPDNNASEFLRCEDSTTIRTRIYSDGDVWTSDAGTLTSDERLKTNVNPATDKLADINALQVKNFEWIPEYHPAKVGEKKIGFIAQEFETVFPSLVNEHTMKLGDEEVSRKSIRYGALIPILVKAIQELSAKVEALENA